MEPLGLSSCSLEKAANPNKVINDLKGFQSKIFHFGNLTIKLDKKGVKHILERHHPKYWDGSIKKEQSLLSEKMSINDVSDAINNILKQNRNNLINKERTTMYQVHLTAIF